MTRVYRKSMREALEEMRANQLGAIQEAEENPLVKKKPDGTYCVYRSDGSIAKEFDNKEDANDYARNNHDDLILDEARRQSGNYDLYHKDFSSAMQHAYKMAKKLHGITISPDEISDKVATGPKKPSEGKTNKYRLEGDKGGIQIQVYNKGGSKPYELNMYKEEVELDEGKFQVKTAASKKGKITVTDFDSLDDAKKHLADMEKKGQKGIISKDGNPIKESARSDAMRAMWSDHN